MDYDFKRAGWHWAAKQFADGLKDASSYPLSYLYATWLALSGHMLGRRVFMYFPRRLYPNHYICLVGPSAQGRKSTAMALGYEAIEDLCRFAPPLRAVTTSHGLLQAMTEQGGTTMVMLDELSAMTSKSRMEFGRDLVQRLTELYDCPKTAGTYTKQNPITVYDPFLSILSASTVEWIQATVSASDMMGGLGNRMTFVLGDERPTMAWPGRPHHTLDWTILHLAEGEVQPTEECRDLWTAWYTEFDRNQRKSSPFLRTLAQRIPEKVWKTALTMSAWDGQPYITDASLEMAMDWGEYLLDTLRQLVPAFEDHEKQVFHAIVEGYDSKRSLYTLLRHRMHSGQIQQAIRNLTWMGAIVNEEDWYAAKVDSLDELEEAHKAA